MIPTATDPRHLPGIRWAILRTCRVGGHTGATDRMIREVIAAEYLLSDMKLVRDELDYLKTRNLVEITVSEVGPWRVKLTRYGYDIADYQIECEAGIARPPRIAAIPD